jgi:hypothetical protein
MNKIELMTKLTSSFSLYEAAKWLSKERAELNNQTPADYIKQNQIEDLNKLLDKDIKEKNGSN